MFNNFKIEFTMFILYLATVEIVQTPKTNQTLLINGTPIPNKKENQKKTAT